jgi:hypothetical protein
MVKETDVSSLMLHQGELPVTGNDIFIPGALLITINTTSGRKPPRRIKWFIYSTKMFCPAVPREGRSRRGGLKDKLHEFFLSLSCPELNRFICRS